MTSSAPPAPRWRRRDWLGLSALASLGLAPAVRADDAVAQPWPASRPLPPLDLPGHGSPGFRLAGARGRPVLLNFWASWCEPCRSEMPSLELLAERLQPEGLLVMTINYRETPAAIDRFLALMPVGLPILRDADGATSRAWGARVFPTTVLVGRDGRPQVSWTGEVDWTGEPARRALAALLKR